METSSSTVPYSFSFAYFTLFPIVLLVTDPHNQINNLHSLINFGVATESIHVKITRQ